MAKTHARKCLVRIPRSEYPQPYMNHAAEWGRERGRNGGKQRERERGKSAAFARVRIRDSGGWEREQLIYRHRHTIKTLCRTIRGDDLLAQPLKRVRVRPFFLFPPCAPSCPSSLLSLLLSANAQSTQRPHVRNKRFSRVRVRWIFSPITYSPLASP